MLILLTFFLSLPSSHARADAVVDAFQAQGLALDQYSRVLSSKSVKPIEVDAARKKVSQATHDLAEAKHQEHDRATDAKNYASKRSEQPSRLFAKESRAPASATKDRSDADRSSHGSGRGASTPTTREEVILDGSKIPKVYRFRGRE